MPTAFRRLALSGCLTAGAIAAASAGDAGCNGPPPGAPSPVIVATPSTVCKGDEYTTPITLDGTQSSPALTLVPAPAPKGAPPLRFLWTLTGSAYRIADLDAGDGRAVPSGTLTSDKLVVTMAGDQPLQVDLHLENPANGGTADTTTTIAITPLDEAGVCPLVDSGAE